MELHQNENFSVSKDSIKKMKWMYVNYTLISTKEMKTHRMGEIFSDHVTDKGLTSRIYEDILITQS